MHRTPKFIDPFLAPLPLSSVFSSETRFKRDDLLPLQSSLTGTYLPGATVFECHGLHLGVEALFDHLVHFGYRCRSHLEQADLVGLGRFRGLPLSQQAVRDRAVECDEECRKGMRLSSRASQAVLSSKHTRGHGRRRCLYPSQTTKKITVNTHLSVDEHSAVFVCRN